MRMSAYTQLAAVGSDKLALGCVETMVVGVTPKECDNCNHQCLLCCSNGAAARPRSAKDVYKSVLCRSRGSNCQHQLIYCIHRLAIAMQSLRAASLGAKATAQQQLLTPITHKAPFTGRRAAVSISTPSTCSSSSWPAQQAHSSSRPAQRRTLEPTAAAAPAAAVNATEELKIVEVDLGDRSYPIYIGQNLLQDGARLRQHIPGNRVLIVTNTTIAPLYLQK